MEPSLEIQFVPDEAALAKCVALGTAIAAKLVEVRKAGEEMTKKLAEKPAAKSWKCLVCGHIYEPEKGDPEHGIPPGTRFEDLPNDWTCPLCNAPKAQFEEINE